MSTYKGYNFVISINDELVRALIIRDEISRGVAITLKRLGRAPWNTSPYLEDLEMNSSMRVIIKQMARNADKQLADPSIHLAPNHQEYTPNYHKQRRDKFKRSGRG